MNELVPSTAYDQLTPPEQSAVSEYVNFIEVECVRRGLRIANAIELPIPTELVKRSRGILEKPLVKAAIVERLTLRAHEQDISPSRVVNEHARLAFSNMADYLKFTPGPDGSLSQMFDIDLSRCTREQMAAVKSVETKLGKDGWQVKITLYDKQASLEALSEIMVMPQIAEFNRKGGQVVSTTEAARAYAELLETM